MDIGKKQQDAGPHCWLLTWPVQHKEESHSMSALRGTLENASFFALKLLGVLNNLVLAIKMIAY